MKVAPSAVPFIAQTTNADDGNNQVDQLSQPDDLASNPVQTRTRRVKRKICTWSDEEHTKFLIGLTKYRKNVDRVGRNGEPSVGLGPGIAQLIADLVGTRTSKQVRSHAQKYFLRQRTET